MPRREAPKAVQWWGCNKCKSTYDSPIVLSAAPTHRCPSPISRKVESYILRDGPPPKPVVKKPAAKVMQARDIYGPTHVVADPGDNHSLCGVKEPLPVVAQEHLSRHLDKNPKFVVCGDCSAKLQPEKPKRRLQRGGRRVTV